MQSWTTPLKRVSQFVRPALTALDQGLVVLAGLFGVYRPTREQRYGLFLGIYAALYLVAFVPVPALALAALGFGYLGVVAVGRAWVANEKQRTNIAKKLDNTDPDTLPDLRWLALLSALQLLILFPLLFHQLHEEFRLFTVSERINLWSWWVYALDPYGRAVFGWLGLPDGHVEDIAYQPGSPAARLVLLRSLTFDYILIQGVMRLFAIHTTIQEGVAALKQDPDMAKRLGRRAVGPLTDALADPDDVVRERAALVLGELNDARAVAPLLAVLNDPVREVRWQAATALGNLGDAQAVPALAALLRDPDDVIRSGAVLALAKLGNPAVPAVLELTTAHESSGVRVAALEVLKRLGKAAPPDALPPALNCLNDADEEVRKAAVEVLGAVGDLQAVEPLRHVLRDPATPSSVRAEAVRAAEALGDARVVPELIPLLQDADRFVAKWSAHALGKLGDRQAVPPLIAALRHAVADVREEAALALAALGDARAVGPLGELAHDKDENVQAAAEKALETLQGPAATSAGPARNWA